MTFADAVMHIYGAWLTLRSWFASMLLRAGALSFYHVAIFLLLVSKFILGPIFGYAAGSFLGGLASDRVSKRLDQYDKSMRGASNPQKRLPGGKK